MEPKFQILKSDYIDFRHPTDKRQRIVRLYRIISLRELSIPGHGGIALNEIGGYVESEANLSHDGDCWITHSAKVFDKAHISGNALIKDDAAVFEEATVDGSSIIGDYARICGRAGVKNSVIGDRVDVKGDARVMQSTLRNASAVYERAQVVSTTLYDGAMVHGDAIVEECTLHDVSEVRGKANLFHCKLTGRAIVQEGDHKHEGFSAEVELNVTTGKGELK